MSKTPVMVLQELCQKKCYAPPTYEIIHCISGTHNNRFDYRVCVNGITAIGTGSSKQISKHQAARNLLIELENLNIYNPRDNPVDQFQTLPANKDCLTSLNHIGNLKDICIEHKIPDPVFTLISDCGPPHKKEFTYECKVSGITTLGRGNTKKIAKHLAARDMLERIKDVLPELKMDYSRNDEEEKKAISCRDDIALQKYNRIYGNVVADKTVKVCDFSLTLKKLMKEYEKNLEDFTEDLEDASEESLERILAKLNLNHTIDHIQDNPTIVAVMLTTDTPFAAMGMASNLEDATSAALTSIFEMMNVFMRLEL